MIVLMVVSDLIPQCSDLLFEIILIVHNFMFQFLAIVVLYSGGLSRVRRFGLYHLFWKAMVQQF